MSDAAPALARLQDLCRFGMRPGLSRIHAALEDLARPHLRYATIHVAGTNGKGSTAAMIASCLRQVGLRTGLFTSPHLQRFGERITVDGREIGAPDLSRLIDRVLGEDPPLTFFEAVTAVGLAYFAERQVDCAVVETGLGGRLDATNVLRPEVVVLTSISRDHEQVLGEDLAGIAAEKAGIIKPGTDVVAARPEQPAVEDVIARRCAEAGARLHWIDRRGAERRLRGIRVGLAGEHQRVNAALALASVERLARRRVLRVPDAAMARGLAEVDWPGRLERVGPFLLDCAHNPAGAASLARSLEGHGHCLVFGCLDDKPALALLEPLLPRCERLLLTAIDNPRGVDPAAIADQLVRHEAARTVEIAVAASAAEAVALARADRRPKVVAGSVYLVGEVRALLGGVERDPVSLADPVSHADPVSRAGRAAAV